jgi:hypothetical protein
MKFLKLTNWCINTKFINTIFIKKNSIVIYLSTSNIEGLTLFSTGFISSKNQEIEICKIKNPTDYTTVSEWMKSLN